jgi:hypothetical protein
MYPYSQGLCCKIRFERSRLSSGHKSCSECIELSIDRECVCSWKEALLFMHHVNACNVRERDDGCGFGFETKRVMCASFETAMILFNAVVHVFVGTNDNGFASLSKRALCITFQYCSAIGLASVNGDALRPAILAKALRRKRLATLKSRSLLNIGLNRIAIAVNRTIQVQPLAFDLDVSLIEVRFACDLTLLPIEPFKQFWTKADDPTMDG